MRKIKLTQGKTALVSDQDWSRVRKFKWYAVHMDKQWYAQAALPNGRRNPPTILLHQFIRNGERHVDHRNCNGLDNRRRNLRSASRSQNLCNRGKTRANTSGFKGVTWSKEKQKWQAQIKFEGVYKMLGRFKSKRKAAQVYARAAKRIHKEFARL
jgi:hypothetical protein